MEQAVTIDIAAPPRKVWDVLTDVEAWPQWTSTVTSVRRLDDGPLRAGSRAKVVQPRIPDTEYVVTELAEGTSFTWVASGPGVRTTARHELEPLSDTMTRVRLSVVQSGWLGTVMGRFYRGLTDRYLATEANGLKDRSERS
ncbi:MAG: SRPBCC family protein [Dermatophilaceae bacterium]